MSSFKSPSKEDFIKNTKSNLIWHTCVETLQKAKEINIPDSDKILIQAQLIGKMNELEGMGLFAGMKSNLPKQEYQNPLSAVEYIAGQILDLLEHGITPADEALKSVNFDEKKISDDSNNFIIKSEELTLAMHNFSIDQQMIVTLERFLDVKETS